MVSAGGSAARVRRLASIEWQPGVLAKAGRLDHWGVSVTAA